MIENQEYDPDPNTVDSPMNGRKLFRVVAQDVYTVPEEPDILDEQVEGYKFSRQIQLPKKLTKCLQDANTRGIKIRHKLKFNVLLHNPDKHTSELRATLPVALYISPSLAINEDNEVVDQTPVAARRAMQTDLAHQTPPLYGDHQLDQLYSEVDFSGYRTPGNVSTPGTPFGSHSRNISSENLFALDEASGGSSAPAANGTGPGDVSAAALRSRLQNLRSGPTPLANECNPNDQDTSPDVARRTSATNGSRHGDYFSSETSSRRSRSRSSANGSRSVTPGPDRSSIGSGTNLSRRTSDEDDYLLPSGAQTPEPRFYEIEYLSRVPSYATAVRAPAHQPYSGSDLPSYGDATSRNGSLSSSPNAGLEPPPTAHLRGQIAGAVESLRGESTLSARDLRLPGRSGPLGRTVGEIQDEDRRFRLMQARGRS